MRSGHDHLCDAGGEGGSTPALVPGSGLASGGAASGSRSCPPKAMTGSPCAAPLASSPLAAGGVLDGTSGAAVPPATAASGWTAPRASRP
jgi:hypothetical protein